MAAGDSTYDAYITAILATMQCKQLPSGMYHCLIPVLEHWEATNEQEDHCCNLVTAQIIIWIAEHYMREEPLPPFAGFHLVIEEVVLPDIFTEQLRLVPYTVRLKAAAVLEASLLATLLGAEVPLDWPYPLVTFDDEGKREDSPEALSAEEGVSEDEPWTTLALWHVVHALSLPAGEQWEWLIIHRADNVLIGEIGTTNPPRDEPGDRHMQFGYSLVPAYWNRGYMTEAARVYLAWAFSHPEMDWAYATTDGTNLASRRVLEKLGGRIIKEDAEINWLDWEIMPDAFCATQPQP